MVGMLPKEFQDMIFQNGQSLKESNGQLSYEGTRDYVLNIANQRSHMARPVPMDVGAVRDQQASDGEQWARELEDRQMRADGGYYADGIWVDVVSDRVCYNCGKPGHIARNCFSKGKGKGDSPSGKGGKGKGGKGGFEGGGKGGKGKGGKGSKVSKSSKFPGGKGKGGKGFRVSEKYIISHKKIWKKNYTNLDRNILYNFCNWFSLC